MKTSQRKNEIVTTCIIYLFSVLLVSVVLGIELGVYLAKTLPQTYSSVFK